MANDDLLEVRVIEDYQTTDYKSAFELKRDKLLSSKSVWQDLIAEYSIDAETLVLVLAGENEKLDEIAMKHLPMFIKRKKAERVEIFVPDEDTQRIVQRYAYDFPVHVDVLPKEKMCAVYDYYCYAFNMDNIAFTFLQQCPYNLLGRILEETEITEADAVDLGVYWLRRVYGEDEDVRG